MMTSRRLESIFSSILISFLISGLVLQGILPTFSHAASTITSDGTMGTTVAQSGKIYNIGGGTIRGTNQFQSFGLFSVGTGDTASFNGPVGIANIIGRVTGGQQSIIDGILKSTISGANLYLLNPYGVLFGKNASLSVSGSFHISTADYLKLSDGGMFYSNPLSSSVLTTAPPLAFGFLSNTPAAITIQESFLQVPRYKTLSVIGGDINITGGPSGYLYAPSGRVNLASVASNGEVIPVESRNAPDLQLSSFDRLGNINLSNLAYLNTNSSAGNGTVVIRGGRFQVENSYLTANTTGNTNGAKVGIDIKATGDFVANNGYFQSGTTGGGSGGDILIKSGSMDVRNLSSIEATSSGSGSTGNIEVETGNLTLTQGGQIRLSTWASGNTGNLIVKADRVFITGAEDTTRPTSMHNIPNTGSTGKGGDVRLTVGSLELRDAGQIYTTCYGSGPSGVVEVNADSVLLSGRNALGGAAGIFSNAQGKGNSGGVRINTESLEVRNGAQISTSSSSSGNSGNLEVTADRILLTEDNSGLATGLFARGHIGNGGDIRINTGSLEVMGGATISASSRRSGAGGDIEVTADSILLSGADQFGNRSGIYSQSDGSLATGAAGDIRINAGSLEVKDGAQITVAALGPGNSGTLEINADSVLVSGTKDGHYARLNSSTQTNAMGGNIRITTSDLEVKDGGRIQASTYGTGDAGTIEINADQVLVSGVSEGFAARITAQANPGSSGRGGDISITADSLEVREGSDISVTTAGKGDGGTINIAANSVILDGGTHPEYGVGIYSTTEGNGNAGSVKMKAGNLDMRNGAQIGVGTSGDGNAGTINLDLNYLNMTGGAFVFCVAYSERGNGGDIMINAAESILISGKWDYGSSAISSNTLGQGSAGNIKVSTPSLVLENEAKIAADTFGNGRGGNIDIQVDNLNLSGGAHISSSTHSPGIGAGGNVTVNATNIISILGGSPEGMPSSILSTAIGNGDAGNIAISSRQLNMNGGFIGADTMGDGSGGSIDIKVNNLSLSNAAMISSGTHGGAGKGGTIAINASDTMSISGRDSGLYSISMGPGTGGNIEATAKNIFLVDESTISASSTSLGDAGNIDITTNYLLMNNSSITTEAKQADGGNINIHAGYMVKLIDSKISASVGGGPDTVGGNITIDPEYVILNDSQIIANAYEGKGGNIRIIADVFLASPESIVDASSALGIDGTVDIQAPISSISGTLAPMQGNFLSTEALLRDRCIARIRGERISSFVVSGRDGLPIRPGNVLPSPIY